MPKFIALLMLLLIMPGCSLRFTALNATVCPFTNTKTTDIAFGKLDRQKLDVYKPRSVKANPPIVIFFYGGAWQDGEKGYYKFAAEALTSRGFVAVVPDYRLYPQTSFPNFLNDCALAVKWTKDHAKEIGGDETKIFLMGHSAGAYNAVMISLDPRYLNHVGLTPNDIRGTIGLAGPYDFWPTPYDAPAFNINPHKIKAYDDMEPICQTTKNAPPMLLINGSADVRVNPGNSKRLAEKLQHLGNHAVLKIYDGIDHTQLVLSLAGAFRWLAPTLNDSADFINQITNEEGD